MYASMKSLTAFFGEDWDANDPSRVLRIVRNFMNLFNKAHQEIEVRHYYRPAESALMHRADFILDSVR